MSTYAVILAGGSGTRFWPASTHDLPKQMLPLTGGAPLLRETVDRLAGLIPPARIVVVTAARHAAAVRAMLPEIPPDAVLGEPRSRNTAAASAWAAHHVARFDPTATLVTLPADHVVSPVGEFCAALAASAARAADARTLVTLGLRPTHAATGYGWIQLGAETASVDGRPVHAVASFVEKPDRARAELFLARRDHLWNLGMFAWRADVLLDEVERHLPGVAGPMRDAAAALGSADAEAAIAHAFDACTSISVDHGILEHSDRVECVPCSFAWDDLGSFEAIARHVAPDADGNHVVGRALALESAGCVVWSEPGRLVALLEARDLIVVNANGVTLVAPRWRAQDVRELVARLSEQGLEDFR